jgi:hypothetical protein
LKSQNNSPFNMSGRIQIYLLYPLILTNALLKLGARQVFLPNLATSVVMVFMQVSTNSSYCSILGPARFLDVGPLSMLPRALDVITFRFFSPAPWPLDDTASCPKNIAALQVGIFVCKSASRFLGS